ncbi:MAG TPA: hypothetical protein VF334_12530 [Polyangia bacterium]
MVPFDFSSIAAQPWFQAWQRAAADSMAAAARDPRVMRLGAGLLRSQLLWGRAVQNVWLAAWAPIDAMSDPE